MYNEVSKNATTKYIKNSCDRLCMVLKKGEKDKWRDKAQEKELSLTQYIRMLIENDK